MKDDYKLRISTYCCYLTKEEIDKSPFNSKWLHEYTFMKIVTIKFKEYELTINMDTLEIKYEKLSDEINITDSYYDINLIDEDFKNLIGLSNLHIMESDKNDFAYIGFELGCDWDDEHGVGIMMHKDRVVAIGLAETSFDNWVTFDDNGTSEIEKQNWNEANAKLQSEGPRKTEKQWWKFW
jgi:hypothetical protein